MGKIINANAEEFQQIIDSEEGVVLVDFWAEWCGPCRMLSPILEDVSEEVDNVTIVKVNVDENTELSAQHEIRGIPTIIVYKEGNKVDRLSGLRKKDELIEVINKNSDSEKNEEDESEED